MARPRKNEYAELAEEYRKLVQAANKRLQRLEKYAQRPEYGPQILEYAYRTAQREIRVQRGGDQYKRFSAKTPATLKTLRKEINRVNRFMELPSSSLPGIKETYVKRAEGLNKLLSSRGFKATYTWQQYAKFFETGLYQKVRALYGSDVAFKIMGQFVRRAEEIKQYLDETAKYKEAPQGKPPVNPLKGKRGQYDSRLRQIMEEYPEELRDYYATMGR